MVFAVYVVIGSLASLVACSSEAVEQAETEKQMTENVNSSETETQEMGEIYKIRLNTSVAQGTPRSESADICYAETFKEEVEALSNGAIEVEMYYGNLLGSDSDVAAGLSNGSIEFLCTDVTTLSSYYEPSMVLSIPGVISSTEEAEKLFESNWWENMVEECASSSGIRILGTMSKGFRNFTTVNKPLKTPEDMNGLTLRVINNPLYIEMVNSLSANAVPMNVSELYTALQNGVVDGHENSIPNILQDKTYELEKYLVLDAHTGSYFCGMISEKFYQSLPDELKEDVNEASKRAQEETEKTVEKIISNGLQTLRDNGVEIYEPTDAELEKWYEAYADNTLKLAQEEMGEAVVNDFMKAVENLQ